MQLQLSINTNEPAQIFFNNMRVDDSISVVDSMNMDNSVSMDDSMSVVDSMSVNYRMTIPAEGAHRVSKQKQPTLYLLH